MEPIWMEAGQIVGVHGVHGEVRVLPLCDSAEFLLPLRRFALQPYGTQSRTLITAESSRAHKGQLLLKLTGIDSREAAQALRQAVLFFDRNDVSLPQGKYFLSDLIGLQAVDEDGAFLGTVTEVLQPPAQDVYHITGGESEHWVPAVEPFLIKIDLSAGTVTLRLIEGM